MTSTPWIYVEMLTCYYFCAKILRNIWQKISGSPCWILKKNLFGQSRSWTSVQPYFTVPCVWHYVVLPCVQFAETCRRMDERIRDKIIQLATVGVRRLPEIRRHLQHCVENDLFSGRDVPPRSDARFWPNSRQILNCAYRASTTARFLTLSVPLYCIAFAEVICAHHCSAALQWLASTV